MVVYNFLNDCSEIDKTKFQTENWYLMNWGMGDAIDATLFLESNSPVSYKILCRPGIFNGIKFVLDNFITNPKCELVEVFPLETGYPIPEDEVIMSKHGFHPQDLNILNNAHNIKQLKVCHMAPKMWSMVQNLHGNGILSKIEKYSSIEKDIEEKTCILFPERGDSYQLDDSFWNDVILKMQEKGYRVIVNWTNKTNVFTNQKIFEGTEKLDKLELQDLLDYLVRHKNLVTIGQISGIFVLLKYFEFLKIAFFVDYNDPKMKDPTRALYESCSLSDGLYTKNMLEFKLSKFNVNQLDLVIQ
jgi:hypothetical protein